MKNFTCHLQHILWPLSAEAFTGMYPVTPAASKNIGRSNESGDKFEGLDG